MAVRLAYTTTTGNPNHAEAVARIHAARVRPERQVTVCPDTSVEPHEAGEFPMSCRRCHVVVNGFE